MAHLGHSQMTNPFDIHCSCIRRKCTHIHCITHFFPRDINPYKTPVANISPLPIMLVELVQRNIAGSAILKQSNNTHRQYPAALFQYGLFSTQSLRFCTKSMNRQQQGASIITTKNPAIICHMPPIKHSTWPISMDIQSHAPRKIATEQSRILISIPRHATLTNKEVKKIVSTYVNYRRYRAPGQRTSSTKQYRPWIQGPVQASP